MAAGLAQRGAQRLGAVGARAALRGVAVARQRGAERLLPHGGRQLVAARRRAGRLARGLGDDGVPLRPLRVRAAQRLLASPQRLVAPQLPKARTTRYAHTTRVGLGPGAQRGERRARLTSARRWSSSSPSMGRVHVRSPACSVVKGVAAAREAPTRVRGATPSAGAPAAAGAVAGEAACVPFDCACA